MTPYNKERDPEGSTRQGQEPESKRFVFEKRRVARASVVPAPVAIFLLGCAVAAVAVAASTSFAIGSAAIACTIATAILLQVEVKPSMYHDAGHDVLCVRKGVSWRALAGFRCTHLPTNVDGNQKRLLRHLHGIDPRVTFKVVASRHEFLRESRSRSGSWFAPKGDSVTMLGAGESGHAWFLVLERPANLLLGIKHEVAALARARDATKSLFPNTYPHHQFRAATAGELALVAAW
jgi:hypothetical protein